MHVVYVAVPPLDVPQTGVLLVDSQPSLLEATQYGRVLAG
jgi:hypothetical protein